VVEAKASFKLVWLEHSDFLGDFLSFAVDDYWNRCTCLFGVADTAAVNDLSRQRNFVAKV